MSRPIKCCLCGRPAFTWHSCFKVLFPELVWVLYSEVRPAPDMPLCDECTLSAWAQRKLLWPSDVERVLGTVA
jgi:hypothetical protein